MSWISTNVDTCAALGKNTSKAEQSLVGKLWSQSRMELEYSTPSPFPQRCFAKSRCLLQQAQMWERRRTTCQQHRAGLPSGTILDSRRLCWSVWEWWLILYKCDQVLQFRLNVLHYHQSWQLHRNWSKNSLYSRRRREWRKEERSAHLILNQQVQVRDQKDVDELLKDLIVEVTAQQEENKISCLISNYII